MIFIDSNIPMYLVGRDHPNKHRAAEVLRQLVRAEEHLVTGVEVYQEILHRYSAIERTEAIDPAFAVLDELVDDVLGYGMAEIRAARALLRSHYTISARDALHVAVMREAGISRILSFDREFDDCPGVERLA